MYLVAAGPGVLGKSIEQVAGVMGLQPVMPWRGADLASLDDLRKRLPVPIYTSIAKVPSPSGIRAPEIHRSARRVIFSWEPEPGEIAEWFGLVLGCREAIVVDAAGWRRTAISSAPRAGLGCLFHDLKEIDRQDVLAAGAMVRQLGLQEAAPALVLIAEAEAQTAWSVEREAIRGALRRAQRALTGRDPGAIVHLVDAKRPVGDAWYRLCDSYHEYFALGGSLGGAAEAGREVRELCRPGAGSLTVQ